MSRWYEPIDRGPGAGAIVRSTPGQITFELPIHGIRPKRAHPTRLFLRCTDDGEITARLLEGKSTAA